MTREIILGVLIIAFILMEWLGCRADKRLEDLARGPAGNCRREGSTDTDDRQVEAQSTAFCVVVRAAAPTPGAIIPLDTRASLRTRDEKGRAA